MIEDFILFKALPGKVDDVKKLYAEYLAGLRDKGDSMVRYALYQSKSDEVEFVTHKVFATRADEQWHHTEDTEMFAFIEELNAMCEGGDSHFFEAELFDEHRATQ